MPLREDQIKRYARHILLPDVGGLGQARLLAASVAVRITSDSAAEIAALAYLAAAGVGDLRLVGDPGGPISDAEVAGGILYGATDVGRPRLDVIRERIAALNPDVSVKAGSGPADLAIAPPAGDVAAALRSGGGAAVQLLARLIGR